MKSKIDTCMHLSDARIAIDNLPSKFDSHEFIKKYSDLFVIQYKDLISHYTRIGSAHALIGSFLSRYSRELCIESCGRTKSTNVHGDKTECELWRKI